MGHHLLSIALCTYNGARYIQQQLQSIALQTRKPDELVVRDDRSTDQTVEIVEQFARTAPFPVRWEINPANMGSTRNFEGAIRCCRGDLIFLCDQDDLWEPRKLQQMENAFQASPEAACVFSDAQVVDQRLQPLGYRLWETVRLSPRRQRYMTKGESVNVLLRQNVVTGATMAFRGNLRDVILPIPPSWMHDGWIALLCAGLGGCIPLAQTLMRYRQHPEQQIGARKSTFWWQLAVARAMNRDYFLRLASDHALARDRMAAFQHCLRHPEVLTGLDQKIAHCLMRARMRQKWAFRPPLILAELIRLRYQRYSLGWKSIAQDICL